MPVIGSSSIIPSASIGPQGPTGAAGGGFTGGTGPTGSTGSIGVTGTYVVSSYHEWPYVYYVLSDGTEIKVDGVAGVTGESGYADGVNSGSGVGIFKEVSGGMTFWFKGISAEGSLIVYETDNTIGISGDKVYQQGATAEISDRLRFAYLSAGNTADVSGLTFDTGLTGTIIFGHGPTGNRWSYDPEEIVVSVPEISTQETVTIYGGECEGDCGQTAGRGVGIQLGVTSGSVYSVQTPIGIAGFTGEFHDGETFRFTMLLHGNNIWDWPSNVYFDETDIFFSCGTDILGLSTSNKGKTWYANIASRGYGVEGCESVYGLGSCCYINDNGLPDCEDYVPENTCSLKNQSFWNPLSTCSENCGKIGEGVCCSEGGDWHGGEKAICLEGIGPAECNYFNAQFWDYFYYEMVNGKLTEVEPFPVDCDEVLSDGTPHSDICFNPCDIEDFACCRNGSCLGDTNGNTNLGVITPVACKYVYGGLPVSGLCGEIDCCDHIVHEGACCIIESSSCINTTNTTCAESNGVFMGPDTLCEFTNCCYDQIGWCCNQQTGNCDPSYEIDCEPGQWYRDKDTCDNSCTVIQIGACCTGEECSQRTQIECETIGGTYFGDNIGCFPNPCEEDVLGTCCYVIKVQNSADPTDVTLGCETEVTLQKCIELSGEFPIGVVGRYVFRPGVGSEYSCQEIGCQVSNLNTFGCIPCPSVNECGYNCCCPERGTKRKCYDTGFISSPIGLELFEGLGIEIRDIEEPSVRFHLALRQCSPGRIDWEAWGLQDWVPRDPDDGSYALDLWIDAPDDCVHTVMNYAVTPPEVFYETSCSDGEASCEPVPIFGYDCTCGCGDNNQTGPRCPGDDEESCPCQRNCRPNFEVICGEYDPCENAECTGETSELCTGGRSARNMNDLVKLPDGRCVWMMDGINFGFPSCQE